MAMVEQANKHMAGSHATEEARIWKVLRIVGWSGAAMIILLPLIAGQFTNEINWTISDFIFAAIILGGTGLTFELAMRHSIDNAFRTGILLALAAAFLLVWTNAAVGFIGAGANPANILYAAMLAIPIIGSVVAGFRAKGMTITMIVTAIVQAGITAYAFAIDLVKEEETILILAVNAIFIALWIGSALLFAQAAEHAANSTGDARKGLHNTRATGIHFLLSILLIVVGAILTVAMITVEGEPGALPLLLVLLGMGWFSITLFRTKSGRIK